MFSQNEEEKYIIDFFKDVVGKKCLLSIGENDGKTLSNSFRLIELNTEVENGWLADLIEPSPIAFEKLQSLHTINLANVKCFQLAIGTESGIMDFHESGTHLGKGDTSLLSTLVPQEKERWKDTEWNVIPVQVLTYADFKSDTPYEYDFISIDAEGLDIEILKQIDLTHTKLLCIEWNSIEQNKIDILEYTSKFGMTKILYQSGENLLICREQ